MSDEIKVEPTIAPQTANSLWLGDRKVKEYGKVALEDVDQVWVIYDDEKKPEAEVVHADEWELKTEKPNTDRQEYFVKSIQGIQKNVLDNLVSHNILWQDAQSTMDWVMQALSNVRNELNNKLFKTEHWELELTPQKCLDVLKETGTEVKPADLNPVEKIIYDHLVSTNVPMADIKQGFPAVISLKKIAEAVFELQVQALEAYIGSPVDRWRLQAIEEAIIKLNEHETPKDSEDGESVSDSDEGNKREDVSGGEDAPVSDPESQV